MMLWDKLPSERREQIFGQGITKQDVADMDATDRSRTIRQYSTKLNSMLNKRIKRQKEVGLYSPAQQFTDETGGKFSIGGKDDNEVVEEIQRAERFERMATSTLRGATEFTKRIGERLGLEGDRLDIQAMSDKVFSTTSKVDQFLKTAGYGHAIGSDELQKFVANYIQQDNRSTMDTEDLVDEIVETDVYGTLRETELDDFGPLMN